MRSGSLKSQWTLIEQSVDVAGEVCFMSTLIIVPWKGYLFLLLMTNHLFLLYKLQDFYAPIEGLDPNDDQHVMVCFNKDNAPYRKYTE